MKKAISLLLAVVLALSLAAPALAFNGAEATQCAYRLYEVGLFNGYGKDETGKPIFGLSDTATRAQGIAMFVRVLGKEEDAKRAAAFDLPFTDLPGWCRGYVGYAYLNNYTKGTSATTFSPEGTLTANQFLTFCLRSLGYADGKDFSYKDPTELAEKLGIIKRDEWLDPTAQIKRGDMVLMAYNTLKVKENLWDNSAAPWLLPFKVVTSDFDADDHLDYYDQYTGKYYADLEYTKGMIVNSDSISRSSSGVDAIVEYIREMRDIFGEFDARWSSGSYAKLYMESAHLSIDDSGKYNVYMRFLNNNVGGTNLWLNFIAYVTNADIARALYGICVERIFLGDLEPMSAELVEKYGGTLLDDIILNEMAHIATISLGGYEIKIWYIACEDDIKDDPFVISGIPSCTVII